MRRCTPLFWTSLCLASLTCRGQQPAVTGAALSAEPAVIAVDVSAPSLPYAPVYPWFGYDEANYSTTAGGRALLGKLHDLSPVPVTIRVHHLLTSGNGTPDLKWSSTGVYREDAHGRPVYDFTLLDGIFDAFQTAGVRPMVELGFMPKDLAADVPGRTEPYQVRFPGNTISGASNNPPKDYAKWRDLVHAVVAHLVARYGAATVLHWPIEVWNEPDIEYWHGSAEDHWRLYDFAVAGARDALPGAMVGGPATTSPRNAHARKFLEGFLQHVESGKSAATGGPVPLDFISFHAKGQPVLHDGEVTMGLREELRDADAGFALVAAQPHLRNLPILLSEADPEGCAACSTKQNPANTYRNGTLYPAYTAAAYKGLLDLAAVHHVHLLGMLSWSFEFEGSDPFEGFRDLTTQGVDKPILNLFRMLGLMSGNRLPVHVNGAPSLQELLADGSPGAGSVDAFATTRNGSVDLLAWNYADRSASAQRRQVVLKMRNLPPSTKRALVTEFRIDSTHSNAYTAWLGMGSPRVLTPEDKAALQRAGALQLMGSPRWMDVQSGTLTVPVDLPPESIALWQVRWR